MTPHPRPVALDMGATNKKGPPIKEAPRVLTTGRGHGMLKVRSPAGVSLPPASEKMQSSTKSVQIPRKDDAVLSPVQAGAGLAGSSSCQARVIQVHVKHDLKAFKRRLAPSSNYPYAPGFQGFRGRFAPASPSSNLTARDIGLRGAK